MTNLEAFRRDIIEAFPELSHHQLLVLAEGWHSLAVETLDDDGALIFKFPKNAEAEAALIRETAILAAIRPALTLTLPVPDLHLVRSPRVFSCHRKLEGGQLLAADYVRLKKKARDHLARDLARFYAELHGLDPAPLAAAGAGPIKPWQTPDVIRKRALPLLRPEVRAWAEQALAAFERLPPDPHGTTYGFFDGHGWAMAFDGQEQRLAGIYDFADPGFGPLHQDFIYSNFISADLTEQIVSHYERETGRRLDRRRISILTACHRLSELAALADDRAHQTTMIGHVESWFAEAPGRGTFSADRSL